MKRAKKHKKFQGTKSTNYAQSVDIQAAVGVGAAVCGDLHVIYHISHLGTPNEPLTPCRSESLYAKLNSRMIASVGHLLLMAIKLGYTKHCAVARVLQDWFLRESVDVNYWSLRLSQPQYDRDLNEFQQGAQQWR